MVVRARWLDDVPKCKKENWGAMKTGRESPSIYVYMSGRELMRPPALFHTNPIHTDAARAG